MPTYEYQCDGCQAIFEVRQRMSDPPPKSHACGSTALHRVLSATSFVLKGTGWYATDYGNRSAPPPEPGDNKASGSGKAGPSAAGKQDATASTASKAGAASSGGEKSGASSKGAGPAKSAASGAKATASAASNSGGASKGGGSSAAT